MRGGDPMGRSRVAVWPRDGDEGPGARDPPSLPAAVRRLARGGGTGSGYTRHARWPWQLRNPLPITNARMRFSKKSLTWRARPGETVRRAAAQATSLASCGARTMLMERRAALATAPYASSTMVVEV